MGRSESIDISHKEMQDIDVLQRYDIREVQKREELYSNTCEECGDLFNTKIKIAKHCGNCTTVANVLYVHYMVLTQRWGIYVKNPNKIVERVFNQQAKPFRRLTQGG